MRIFSPRSAFCAVACLALQARGQALDTLISSPDLWRTTRTAFVQQHPASGFYWLSSARDRAETHSRGVTLFSRPLYQVDIDFQAENLTALTISIYNRGDAGDISRDAMTALMARTVQQLTTLTGTQPAQQGGQEDSDAVKARAFTWQTPATTYLLEYSFTREVKTRDIPFRAEFVRLTVTPAQKPKSFLAQALASASPQAPFDGPSHVKRDPSGDIRIDTVPMVDQGQKGYCVVATAERVLRYYGIPVDENELAELANSSATQGTSNEAMFDSLKKLSERLRVRIHPIQRIDIRQLLTLIAEYNRLARRQRLPAIPDQGPTLSLQDIYSAMNLGILKAARTANQGDVDHFQQMVQDRIDQGIPVLWSVMLGVIPEPGLPPGIGGHMRLIIGYNPDTKEILYSDSWGPGHELKRMPTADAWTMTMAMDSIEPL